MVGRRGGNGPEEGRKRLGGGAETGRRWSQALGRDGTGPEKQRNGWGWLGTGWGWPLWPQCAWLASSTPQAPVQGPAHAGARRALGRGLSELGRRLGLHALVLRDGAVVRDVASAAVGEALRQLRDGRDGCEDALNARCAVFRRPWALARVYMAKAVRRSLPPGTANPRWWKPPSFCMA